MKGQKKEFLWKTPALVAVFLVMVNGYGCGGGGGDDKGSTPPAVVEAKYFSANDGVDGLELWKSDGTDAGTTIVKDINPGGDSAPWYLTAFNGVLFFSAYDGVNGWEFWMSDGTDAGTAMVKDINPSGDSTYGYLPLDEIYLVSPLGACRSWPLHSNQQVTPIWFCL